MAPKFYVTTPIYYVNDRPHIGHVYTTTVADIVARYHRIMGDDVFFLTGTDEHAAKVVDAAAQRGLSPQQWADRNAGEFEQTFKHLAITNNDFIRTSQDRHKTRVQQYVKQLIDTGDVYLGEYEGWYDTGQEEYVPENKAKESDFKGPINGKPLVRKKEKNYFFKLSKPQYVEAVKAWVTAGGVRPEARANEVLARIEQGLNDVPISRNAGAAHLGAGAARSNAGAARLSGPAPQTPDPSRWAISVPGDDEHVIYVWIDALFNYLSTIDQDDRRHYWPADVHLIAKDILWFHAVIWPAMLTALNRPLPGLVYSHSFWISEGQKMGKSLGNFIDLERIDHYVKTFSLDALRWFLASNGPMGVSDSDFAEAKFIEVYNTDLANTVGNCFNRVANMTGRYFGGKLPAKGAAVEADADYNTSAQSAVDRHRAAFGALHLDQAGAAALELVRAVDSYIEATQPFKLAKDQTRLPEVATILYNCAEAMRIVSLLLWPIMPSKAEEMWRRLGCDYAQQMQQNGGRGKLDEWSQWGQLKPGTPILQGDPLFPRYQD